MSRIMQVIDKKTDFSRGTVDLKLYQTNFIGLTKVITSVTGQTVDNAVSGADVGFQFFHDLNTKQLEVRDYVDKYKPKYNAEIATKKKTVTNLIDFSYNWKSCVDYKSQIVSGDKADYRLFQKVVNAEKELYDYRLYAGDHIKRNCEIMASWGMNKKYGSCVDEAYIGDTRKDLWSDNCSVAHGKYTTLRFERGEDRLCQLYVKSLDKIPVGATDNLKFLYKGEVMYSIFITKLSLGESEDDGYYSLDSVKIESSSSNPVRRKLMNPTSFTGKKSPHFTKSSGVYDLEFFKTRKLI